VITGTIFDIKKFSLHDGPGIRTTVFFKGCDMRCRWCHNPESHRPEPELIFRPDRCIGCRSCLTVCTQRAISLNGDVITHQKEKCIQCGCCAEVCDAQAREMIGRESTVEEVMAEIEKDLPFYAESGGGVTFSGGEPLLQKDFLASLLHSCRARGIHTAVDTCGSVDWRDIDSIRNQTDLFLYDLKLVDDVLHRKHTGVSNKNILRNLQKLSDQGQDVIIRVPIVPGITDTGENIRHIGELTMRLSHLRRLDILPYFHIAAEKYRRLHRVYDLTETRPPGAERMSQIADLLRDFGLKVHIGG
jgi:pyruvate formate lyase activating enzyme